MISKWIKLFSIGVVLVLLSGTPLAQAHSVKARPASTEWSNFENISWTATASTSPVIAADNAGRVHVLWSEDVGGDTENFEYDRNTGAPVLDARGRHVNYLTSTGNTLYYTFWDGKKWHKPVDVHTVDGGRLTFPDAVVDRGGMLHVVYSMSIGADIRIMYSRVPAAQASQVRAWSAPVEIDSPSLQMYYPAGIAMDGDGNLHIVYYRNGVNPGVYAVQSADGGTTWSKPQVLLVNYSEAGDQDGSMPVRLTSDEAGRLHATWTMYDQSGNGRAIYYAQFNTDRQWTTPIMAAQWKEGWYEVDWLSAGAAGDEIHLVWEGGTIAYLNERISRDGGLTWEKPQHILPRLVGENGWSELVTDSAGNLHHLVVKRSGGSDIMVYGMWYSRWTGNRWDQPSIVGVADPDIYENIHRQEPERITQLLQGTMTGDGLRYQRATIVNGNELFVVVVNEYDGELYVTRLNLNAPQVEPQPYPTATATPAATATAQLTQHTPTPTLPSLGDSPPAEPSSPARLILSSIIPVMLLIAGLGFYRYSIRRS